MYEKITPSAVGSRILLEDGKSIVPDNPIIPPIRGDETKVHTKSGFPYLSWRQGILRFFVNAYHPAIAIYNFFDKTDFAHGDVIALISGFLLLAATNSK